MGINFTDTIMAGRHGETSLAGVAIGSSLWVPGFLFLIGVLMATTPLVAQAWGAKNNHEIKTSVQQGLWIALALGIVMMFVLQLLNNLFINIEMESETRVQAQGYVYAVSFGLPALAIFQVLRGLNEGIHLTRPYMYVSLVALLVNIPLNYIFVYGELGLPEMGGAGCGWATTVVLWLEMLVMLLISIKNKKLSQTQWHKNWNGPDKDQILSFLKLGTPIGIALLIESSMFALIALFLAELGATVVAGHQVAMSFISVLFMIPLSISAALTIRCGYCLGKKQYRRARYIGAIGIAMTIFTASIFSTIILVGSDKIATIYTSNSAVQIIAINLLFLAAIFQFSDAIQVAAAGVLRGYKDTRFAFLVVLFAYWGVGLPVGYTLGLTEMWGQAYGAQGFWMGLIIGLGLASVLLAGRFWFLSTRLLQIDTQK